MLNRNSPMPLYHQLAEILRREIRQGDLVPGDRLPSEHVLAETYGIGRPTARQALEILVHEGLLVRRRGSGTFVASPTAHIDLFSLAGTMASFSGAGVDFEVELLSGPKLKLLEAEAFNPYAGTQAMVLSRLSRVGGEPVLVENFFLHPGLFGSMAGMDMRGRSLAQVVREDFHLRLEGGEQRFSIDYPDERLGLLLKISIHKPMLKVQRFLHFPGARNAVYADLFCRTDRFVFTQTIGVPTS
ncbi:MAG: GntR family transcriptional regulator [Deltaproteobacteria bacterium]|nr:GntR family transcriptional regulator [Deltaproteobacteria bacterium]